MPREGSARTTRVADARKWPSILRGGQGISKVVLNHGSTGAKWKSSEGCTEAGYPPQHLAAPTSRLGIGHQGVTGGFSPQSLSTTSALLRRAELSLLMSRRLFMCVTRKVGNGNRLDYDYTDYALGVSSGLGCECYGDVSTV